ncbi:hypothetical protein FRB96_007030 [Tulasnella sp. 330]|nr:hypothetical protein FRB96_007030 [Tulasnella sp. 330]
MYADYSTDSSYLTSYENDRNGSSSTPGTSTSPFYVGQSSSLPLNGSPHPNPAPLSPKDLVPLPNSPPATAQRHSSSPYSSSPRQSAELPLVTTAVASSSQPSYIQHAPNSQRRNSATTSIASEQVVTQYMPTAELASHLMDESASSGFDEGILRALCDLDCGVPLLLDRIKQSMISCRESSAFFKKRAVIEDEYGRTLQKAARMAHEQYALNDGKAGTFVQAWTNTMKLHDVIAENRMRFGARLNEISEELANLAKEVEKNRKATKDLANRYEKALQESEIALEKAKARFDATHEELERILIAKEGESQKDAGGHAKNGTPAGKRALGKAVAKGGMLLKGKNPTSIAKQEEDVRGRMSSYSDAFRKAVLETQSMRQEYFNFQLPRILRSLKECADEIDLGIQYHLSRYAYLFETTVLNDGTTLVPTGGIEDGPGLKPLIEGIDNRGDFRVYMQNYAIATNRQIGPRREGPWEEGFLPPLPRHHDSDNSNRIPQSGTSTSLAMASAGHSSVTLNNPPPTNGHSVASPPTPSYPPAILAAMAQYPDRGLPTFGVHLAEQMLRDAVEVPRILEKCCGAIETYGITSVGLYRLSGTTSKVQKLKMVLDRDVEAVDLMNDEWRMDVNNITSVLKLWLRELPEPLLTFDLYHGYVEAAKTENDRLRQIQLHHKVNDLPDANYATLKYLMGHLHKVRGQEALNSMSATNLSIVFGPTLLGPPPPSMMDGHTGGGTTLQDMNWQCKAIETIIEHYTDIFVDEGDAPPAV